MPLIERAGGVAIRVRLTPPEWRITGDLLAGVAGPRTRALMFNNPLNPAGRVFDEEEVATIARFCVEHDLIAISDEVWEHVLFDGRTHCSLLAEPDMAERTLKIGSAGKMFGLTGWKIGFVCGTPEVVDPVAKAHQFLTFATAPNLQTAVAQGLAWHEDRFTAMRAEMQRSRDRLASGLAAQGYVATASEGTYFLCVDLKASGVYLDDETVCRRLVTEFGVAAIPVSAFMTGEDRATGPETGVIRLCFAKADAVLDEAILRLGRAREALAR